MYKKPHSEMPILDYLMVSTVQGESKCDLLNRHEHFPRTKMPLYFMHCYISNF